ncbi:unnamed protein product [Rotaria socialis]
MHTRILFYLPDFLVPFVKQVEFMAKHPILAMFYADRLCLGICDSERAADIMRKSADDNSPIIGLRLNSIKVDYKTNSSAAATSKTVKTSPCAVRVDIYNNTKKHLQYHTFDSSILVMDIKKFISTVHTKNCSHIRILSNLDDQANAKNYKSFKDFEKYFHERLNKIYTTNEGYRPITNLLQNIEDDGDDEENHQETSSPNAGLSEIFQENPCPSQSMNNEDIIQYVLNHPDMLVELSARLGTLQVASPMQYQSQLYNQQLCPQLTYLPVAVGQTNNGYQDKIFPINNGQTSSQQKQLVIEAPNSYKDIFDDIMVESIACSSTDQISSTSTADGFESPLNDPFNFDTCNQ